MFSLGSGKSGPATLVLDSEGALDSLVPGLPCGGAVVKGVRVIPRMTIASIVARQAYGMLGPTAKRRPNSGRPISEAHPQLSSTKALREERDLV